jgi:protein ImuA
MNIKTMPLSKHLKLLNHLKSADLGRETASRALRLGVPVVDAALGGGLLFGALHELSPRAPMHFGAAAGFALALASLRQGSKQTLWIQQEFAATEAGALYGPGLDLIGLASERILILRVPRAEDALWAMEETLKCRAAVTVIAELRNDGPWTDLTATRRLALAARENGGLGFLLRHRSSAAPSPAATRWEIAAISGARDRFGGLGPATFALTLVKNRRGPCARWLVLWNHHERVFSPALSLGVAAAAGDGSNPVRPRRRAS